MRTESSRGWRRVTHADTRWGTAAVMRGATTPLTNNVAAYDIREVEMGFDLGTDTRVVYADTRWGIAAVRCGVMPLPDNAAVVRYPLSDGGRTVYAGLNAVFRQDSRGAASGRGGADLPDSGGVVILRSSRPQIDSQVHDAKKCGRRGTKTLSNTYAREKHSLGRMSRRGSPCTAFSVISGRVGNGGSRNPARRLEELPRKK